MTANRLHCLIAASLFGVLTSSLAALPAPADEAEPLKVTVKFDDLDLSNPKAAAVLYGRIRAAAMNVCSPFDGTGLSAKVHLDTCVKKAIAEAVTTVNKPALFAVYNVKAGKASPIRLAWLQAR
jgi:UrcA family protein